MILEEYLRIPPLRKYLGHLEGGILREGGIVNWNTPDTIKPNSYSKRFASVFSSAICLVYDFLEEIVNTN